MREAGFEDGIGSANNILIKLIEDHPDVYADGKMTIESIPGEFTKIVIDLPVAELTTKK